MSRAFIVIIALSGWFLAGSYLFYEYHEYDNKLFGHLFQEDDFPALFYHVLMLLTPIFTTSIAYFARERMKLLREVSELEARYKDYYDNAPYGYHSCSSDLTFIDVNQTWLDMLGYRRDEVVGKMKLTDILPGEGRESIASIHGRFKDKGKLDNLQLDFIRKDGGLLAVSLSATAVFDEAGRFVRSRTIVKDDSERKNYEAALKGISDEWRSTFDSMPWGVMLLDGDYSIKRANAYVSALPGVSPGELSSTKCRELIEGSCTGTARGGPGNPAGMIEFSEGGSGRHFRLYGRPIQINGSVTNYVFSLVDISDLKQGERKLLDSRNAFFNMLKDVNAAYNELNELYNNLVLAFANAIDAKSPWTKGHSERVSRYATALAREVGLNDARVAELRTAALLHDIGKIGTYDYLLDKAERLTPDEFEFVKKHPEKSAKILEPISRFGPVIDIVRYHHEQYDGSGYPMGLKGEDIPFMARILCLADSYDSMTADRPYRPAQSQQYAIEEIKRCAGSHFDPDLAEVFLKMLERGME